MHWWTLKAMPSWFQTRHLSQVSPDSGSTAVKLHLVPNWVLKICHLWTALKVKCMFSPTDFLVDISLVSSPCKTGWPVFDHFIIVLLQPQSVLCSYPGHEADSVRGYQRIQAWENDIIVFSCMVLFNLLWWAFCVLPRYTNSGRLLFFLSIPLLCK